MTNIIRTENQIQQTCPEVNIFFVIYTQDDGIEYK